MKKIGAWMVVGFSIVGVVFAAIALRHYVIVQGAGFDAPSFCNLSEKFNCDAVAASSYATLFHLPVAGLGLIFFAVQLLFGCWAAWQVEGAQTTARMGLLFALLGIFPSAYLLYAMAAVLSTFCLTCLAIDVSLLFVIVGWWLVRGDGPLDRAKISSHLATIGVVAGVGILFLLTLNAATDGNAPNAATLAQALTAHLHETAQPIDLSGTHPSWGASDAKVTIIELSDFQCPFCKVAALHVKPSLAEYHNKVRFVFVNFPLDKSCNDQMQQTMHPMACIAARAGLCANAHNKFWELHDAMFRHQKELTRENIVAWAAEIGLAKPGFETCLDDPATNERVRADAALGKTLGIQGTPSFFVNGRPLRVWQSKEFLRAVIDAELK